MPKPYATSCLRVRYGPDKTTEKSVMAHIFSSNDRIKVLRKCVALCQKMNILKIHISIWQQMDQKVCLLKSHSHFFTRYHPRLTVSCVSARSYLMDTVCATTLWKITSTLQCRLSTAVKKRMQHIWLRPWWRHCWTWGQCWNKPRDPNCEALLDFNTHGWSECYWASVSDDSSSHPSHIIVMTGSHSWCKLLLIVWSSFFFTHHVIDHHHALNDAVSRQGSAGTLVLQWTCTLN